MKPITRKEMLMAKAAGQETPNITPVTREEIFLAKAAGMDVPELEPVTRNEWFISQISGGGGGGSSDFSIAEVTIGASDLTYETICDFPSITTDEIWGDMSQCGSMVIDPYADPITVPVILYKGKGYMEIHLGPESEDPIPLADVTGGIEYDLGSVLVTGNGTIALKPNPDW